LNVDHSALFDFLGYRYIPAPKTLYRNCFKLPPAHRLSFDFDSGRISGPVRYWSLPTGPSSAVPTVDAAAEELRALIDSSVKEQMIADVPLGFFLSGGVDSSVVVASAASQASALVTFSIGFDSDEKSETPYAREIARLFGTEHHERILGKEHAQDLLPMLRSWFDEPFADESALPTFLVSQAAREQVTVVLTGDGGDEVFGGYRTYPRWERYADWPAWPKALATMSARLRRRIGRVRGAARLLQTLETGFSDGLDLWARIMLGMPRPDKESLRVEYGIPADYDDWWHFREYWREDLPIRTRLQYLDFHSFMPGLVLTKVDRTSMAVSLEARVPLLAQSIIEFSFSLPESIRLAGGELKGLLRHAYRGILPDHILDRRKRGFGIPSSYLRDVAGGIPIQQHILRKQFP
jgi:asparagine synthase (glutamine-hydrolysing)